MISAISSSRPFSVFTVPFLAWSPGGWEIAETTGKTAKGPISDEALATEHLVGLCGMERVNEYAITFAENAGRKAPPMDFPGNIKTTRSQIVLLNDRWRQLPVGEVLTLLFPTISS